MGVQETNQTGDGSSYTVQRRGNIVEIVDTGHSSRAIPRPIGNRAVRLLDVLHDALATRPDVVIVDLRRCGEATTPQLAVLIEAMQMARESGTRMIMLGSPNLLELASICRIENMLFGDRESYGVMPSTANGR